MCLNGSDIILFIDLEGVAREYLKAQSKKELGRLLLFSLDIIGING